MIAIGIDPGTDKSGVVIFDVDGNGILRAEDGMDNLDVLRDLRFGIWARRDGVVGGLPRPDIVFIETIEAMGLTVGNQVFQTMFWVGRFYEAANRADTAVDTIRRGDEKIVLCGAATFRDPETKKRRSVTDAQIRQAVIDRFPATGGGKIPQVGVKNNPGPLFGVKGHAWSALAVLITGLELRKG
ncbi:MAG: hypothetical protein JW704_00695 [Anaerolineaceae bacterium]|nr:hypothetical protein [Anaerolineaceae bacterium]